MHIKDILLNREWQNLSNLISVGEDTYNIVNCSNAIVYVAEANAIPTEGELPLSPASTAIYTKVSQDLYLKAANDGTRVSIYKEG